MSRIVGTVAWLRKAICKRRYRPTRRWPRPRTGQDGDRVVIAGRDSAQDSINQVDHEVSRRNLNIQPTLTSRPGLPVRLIVNRDLVLRPYQPLIYQREITP